MQKISISLAIALMIITGILGVGFGYYITPEYRLTMYQNESMDLGPADSLVDKRYLNAMIAHHRSAMLLASQAQEKSERPEIKGLAQKILADEPSAIDELYVFKKEWYKDSRTVKDPRVANLGELDAKFDLRFLNALIAHHEAGLKMTADIKSKSSRTEVLNNADAVENFLNTTMVVLKGWRLEWYQI